MLGLRSAILNKPRASLCLLGVSSLLRLILQKWYFIVAKFAQLKMTVNLSVM